MCVYWPAVEQVLIDGWCASESSTKLKAENWRFQRTVKPRGCLEVRKCSVRVLYKSVLN